MVDFSRTHQTDEHEQELPPPKHELRDVSLLKIALAGLALVVIVVIVQAITAWQFEALQKTNSGPMTTQNTIGRSSSPSALPVEPRLEGVQNLERAAGIAETAYEPRALHERQLQTYGWVDRIKGIVRIPIAEAMQLVVSQPRKEPSQ